MFIFCATYTFSKTSSQWNSMGEVQNGFFACSIARLAWRWGTFSKTGLASSHLWPVHLGSRLVHNRPAVSGRRACLVSTIHLDPLNVLLVLNFLFHVLIPLKDLVVLDFPKLKAFVHASFKLLLKCVTFIFLLAHKVSFTGKNFLVDLDHEWLALLFL